MAENQTTSAIGINLGTTNSSISVFQDGMAQVIPNRLGNLATPSVVAFTASKRLVGEEATNQITQNPKNTLYDINKYIGKDSDDVKYIGQDFPFRLYKAENSRHLIQVKYKGKAISLAPEEISAMLIENLKESADSHLSKPVTEAVISVPANFSTKQRHATKRAALIAGVKILRLIDKPTAVAMGYCFDSRMSGERNIIVLHIGGGTSEASVLTFEDGIIEVKATSGTGLGGTAIDSKLLNHFIAGFKSQHNKDLSVDFEAVTRLRRACEEAKCQLSTCESATIFLDSLFLDIDFNVTITRKQFDYICADLFDECIKLVDRVLRDSGILQSAIDDVILAGKTSKIPKIRNNLEEYIGSKIALRLVDSSETAAHGAAIQAAILSGISDEHLDDTLLLDVTPFSLGIEVVEKIGQDLEELEEFKIRLPNKMFSNEGFMHKIIQKGSTTPVCQTAHCTTSVDYQTEVCIKVFEGENESTKHNTKLGLIELQLSDKNQGHQKGTPRIDVRFDVYSDGTFKVTVSEAGTENIRVVDYKDNYCCKDDLDLMMSNAKQFKADEEKVKV